MTHGRPTYWRNGYIDGDHRTHAVRPGLDGGSAWCGAGAIAYEAPTQFAIDDDTACMNCVSTLRAPIPTPLDEAATTPDA